MRIMQERPDFNESSVQSLNHPFIIEHMLAYAMARNEVNSASAAQRAELVAALQLGLHDVHSTRDELAKARDNAATTLLSLSEAASKHDVDRQTKWTEFLEEKKKEFEAEKKAASELRNIEEPVKLWRTRASRKHSQYWIGVFLLAAAIAVLGYEATQWLPIFLDRVGLDAAGTAQAFTPRSSIVLAVTIAFIAGVAWVLKIVGRVVINSLALAEDAELRSALTDTYLRFIAGETVQEKDRTIMLAALFRPLPGAQQEDIEAPTVLSIAKDALAPDRSSPKP